MGKSDGRNLMLLLLPFPNKRNENADRRLFTVFHIYLNTEIDHRSQFGGDKR